MAIGPEPEQLQTNPSSRLQGLAIGHGLLFWIGGRTIRNPQLIRRQPQRASELMLHVSGEAVRISSGTADVFIEIEAEPALTQPGAFSGAPKTQTLPKGRIKRLHRAPSGQTERSRIGLRQTLTQRMLPVIDHGLHQPDGLGPPL